MTDLPVAKPTSRTAFVLGNGPSLRDFDFKTLSQFPTVGLNAAYRYWQTIGWRPTYYACLDEVVGLSHKDAIAELITEGKIEQFLLRGNLVTALGSIGQTRKVLNFDALKLRQPLLSPPTITTGSHAALWMASMGFDQIVLLGIDGKYKELVDGAETRDGIELEIVETKQGNPNYFFDTYQQVGDRYNIPNPRPGLHVEAWHAAAAKLRDTEVDVYNANTRSAVTVFPYIAADAFFAGASTVQPAREDPVEASLPVGTHPAHEQAQSAARKAKLSLFLKAQGRVLGLAGAALSGGLIASLFAGGWQTGPFLMMLTLCLFGLCTLALLLYTRFAVSQHMRQLQAMQDNLAERMGDIERLNAE